MMGTVRCYICGEELTRPVGKEGDRVIWTSLSLRGGLFCPCCSNTEDRDKRFDFCFPQCLKHYVINGYLDIFVKKYEIVLEMSRIRMERSHALDS
jgi:hypothetical protein